MRLVGMPRGDRQFGDRPDRGQSLAAEAERRDRQQIVAVKLGSGVALDREVEVGARHALAVVADADEPAAAAVGQHLDAARAGIERILDELLDHARRPLHHLAGGDAVDQGFGKLADGHVNSLRPIRTLARRHNAGDRLGASPPRRRGPYPQSVFMGFRFRGNDQFSIPAPAFPAAGA